MDNDLIAPECAIVSPTAGATLQGTITFEAAASDDRSVARVVFYRGTTWLTSDTTAPYTFNTRLVAGMSWAPRYGVPGSGAFASSSGSPSSRHRGFTPALPSLGAPWRVLVCSERNSLHGAFPPRRSRVGGSGAAR